MAHSYAGDLLFNTKLDSEGFSKGAKNISGTGSKLTKQISKYAKVGGAAIASALVFAGKAGIKYNAQMEQYFQSFNTMLGDAQKATEHMKMLKKFAAETPFELNDLAQASQTLLAFGEDVNLVEGDLKMLGDISLGNKEKFSALSLVFGQVKSQGKLMGQDLLQMINAGFNPLTVISKKTGKSVSELKDEMSKGGITFEMVADAMKTATSAGGQFNDAMKAQSKTAIGLWSTLKDNVHAKLGEATEALSKKISNDLLPNAIKFVQKFDMKKAIAGTEKLISLLKIASPLIAGLYITPKASTGVTAVTAMWSKGLKEATSYSKRIAALNSLQSSRNALLFLPKGAEKGLKGATRNISAMGTAVGVLSGRLTIAQAKTILLAKAQALLATVNPYVALAVGLAALVATIKIANTHIRKHALAADKDYQAVIKLARANKEAEKSYDDAKKSAEKDMIQKVAELQNAAKLKKELDGIVGANGRIKQGYEGRAAAIVEVLKAQGIEIEMQDGMIQNYAALSASIDDYIEKKRAELYLASQEEAYKTALKNIKESTAAFEEASVALEKHTKSQAEISTMTPGQQSIYFQQHRDLVKAKADAAKQIEKYNKDIMSYEKDAADFAQGNYGRINAILSEHSQAMESINKENKRQLKERRKDTKIALDALEEYYKDHKTEAVKTEIEAKKEELKAIDDKLGAGDKKISNHKGKRKKATKTMMSGAKEGIQETDLNTDLEAKLEKLESAPKAHKKPFKHSMTSMLRGGQVAVRNAEMVQPFKTNLSRLSSAPNGYRGAISTAMWSLMNAAKNSAGNVSFYDVGYNAGAGVENGILAVKAQVIAASILLINSALDAMKLTANINSPSKKAIRMVGRPLGEGVEVGMLRQAKSLYKTAGDITNKIISAMRPKAPIRLGFKLDSNALNAPRLALGTTIPVHADYMIKTQMGENKLLAKLVDKVDAISARDIKQEVNFYERVYTPGDARDKLAELTRIGLEVDR